MKTVNASYLSQSTFKVYNDALDNGVVKVTRQAHKPILVMSVEYFDMMIKHASRRSTTRLCEDETMNHE